MNDQEFRALLDLIMCSDPWPVDDDNMRIIETLADNESRSRGYQAWVDAYYKFQPEHG